MTCTACLRDKKIVARGLCSACYSRWRKTGTTEYQRWGKTARCQIDDCGKRAVANGLCDMHRKRLERHGHFKETRPDSWGAKEKHPLYNAWAHLRRHKARHAVVAEWVNDFLQFVIDVGARPSPKHKLFAADDSKPIGPENFIWKRAITERAPGEDERTYYNRAQKVYRSLRSESFKGYELKKHYGMSREEYEALARKQGHKCLICGQPEGTTIRGKKISLAVDHCHTKGHVRGLLCIHCNRGLGLFRDSPELLERAAEYLRWPERLI